MNGLGAGAACWARSLLRGTPRYLLLHVNSVCDARCRMCFTWDRMMDRWDARGLPLEAHRKIARSLGDLPQLTVSGGEPLLRRDLPEILSAYYTEANTRFFTVPTNALSAKRVERLVEKFYDASPGAHLNFCLPFHGVGKEFDEVMGVDGAFDRFLETWETIQRLRATRERLSTLLNFVMSKFNVSHWRETIAVARERFPESPLGVALCRGQTHERDAGEVPIAEYEAAQRYLAEHRRRETTRQPYPLMFDTATGRMGEIVAEVARGERRDLGCGAGRHLAVIYDDGTVHPCETLEVVGMPAAREGEAAAPASAALGNLADFDFDLPRLLAAAASRRTTDWIANHPCARTWENAVYAKIVHSPVELVRLGGKIAGRLVSGTRGPAAAQATRRPESGEMQ
ncbi:MAG: radical SAM protein [Thermoanaerobaculia bacterium]